MVSPILISLAALSSIACFITTLMALRAVSEFYKKLRDMEEKRSELKSKVAKMDESISKAQKKKSLTL